MEEGFSITSGLNDAERKLYNSYFKDDTKKIKDYVSKGGALDELVEVAAKLLQNKDLDQSTKKTIYKNLSQAIAGKKIYYQTSQKGKWANRVKNLPVLSKLFKESPLEKARKGRDSIDLRTNEEREKDISSLNSMYNYYINVTIDLIEDYQKQLKPLEEDKIFLQNNLFYSLAIPDKTKQMLENSHQKIPILQNKIDQLRNLQNDFVKQQKNLFNENLPTPRFNLSRNLEIRKNLESASGEKIKRFKLKS